MTEEATVTEGTQVGTAETAPETPAETPTKAEGEGAPPAKRTKTARKENPDADRFYAALGQRVAMARDAAGMSQSKLGKASGITPASICSIEADRQRPPVYTLVKIAHGLGMTDEEARHLVPRMKLSGEAAVETGDVELRDHTGDLVEFLAAKFPPKPEAPEPDVNKLAEENEKLAKSAGIPRVDLASVREEDGKVVATATTAKGKEVEATVTTLGEPNAAGTVIAPGAFENQPSEVPVVNAADVPGTPAVSVGFVPLNVPDAVAGVDIAAPGTERTVETVMQGGEVVSQTVQPAGPSPMNADVPAEEQWMPEKPFVSKEQAGVATIPDPAPETTPDMKRANGGEVCESCGNTAAEDDALFTIGDSLVCEKCHNLLT